jgi:PPOX class probable F420-dependent enzyme
LRAVDAHELHQRAAVASVARLATIDSNGRPHLVPVCFALDGETFYSAVDQKPKTTTRLRRLDNIREHPEVAVLIDHYEDDWSRLWWVRLRGRARVVDGGPDHERGVTLLGKKYEQYRTAPPTGPLIVVSVDEWRGWSASGTMAP